jgi:hypothetical protein
MSWRWFLFTARTARWLSCIALAAMPASGVAADEIIGPYTVVAAPTSAVLLTGGGASFNWLNVVNAPVSIDQALTGFSLIDDGYGNAQSGTTLRLTFAPGSLTNHAGPDLLLLDANNDGNQYRVATSHDGFSHEILVTASTDTGVDRNYFFGGQGPTTFDVMAAAIDLSSLNVPPGGSVDQVRLFTEGGSNDPLGLGVLASPAPVPTTSPWSLVALGLLLGAVAGGRVGRIRI